MQADTEADVLRLQTALRDLVALSAIPATWIGKEPPAVAAGLADALVALLQLDFAFVRLSYPDGDGAVDVMRGNAWKRFPEWLEDHAATSVQFAGKPIVADAGDDSERCRGVVIPIGVKGDGGLVAAASERSDFPTAVEHVLLSLAASQAATAFQNACLIDERRRAEQELRAARNELELKVAERTAELHMANDELSALRRVATLVAQGVRPQDLFAVVAEEVARVVDVPLVNVERYEPDGTATVCGGFSTSEESLFPIGKRWSLEGTNVPGLVRRTSKPARIDDYSDLEGELADVARRRGIRSAAGAPIIVAGRLWGAMVAASKEQDPLADGTEARLAEFTELLATAIENAESREALARLADEQATLRRMATLVAQGVRPDEIFSAVSEEVGRLLGSDTAAVVRFEHDPPAIVVVGVGQSIPGIPIGTRWELDDALASTEVYRTGRSARIDARDWASAGGPVHEPARRLGLSSTVASPIIVEGLLWGTMSVSAKEPLPLDTEKRLEKFTELVATAISNAKSKSELAASRRRVVAASDEARRGIERDLHDGTQQRLVSLGLAVRAAEAQVQPDSSDVRSALSRIATGLADAVAELQELSRGIHPAILSQGGLGPALRTLARRSPIPVELDVATDTRLPEPIEVAAYYVASETLANVAKHAQASRVEVSLAPRKGNLLLSIRDDGVGGADPARGSGLVGLTDRMEALGGSIHVQSRPGDGTQITAKLPLELDVGTNPEQPPAPD
jgi:signal transduction histidine kinase